MAKRIYLVAGAEIIGISERHMRVAGALRGVWHMTVVRSRRGTPLAETSALAQVEQVLDFIARSISI